MGPPWMKVREGGATVRSMLVESTSNPVGLVGELMSTGEREILNEKTFKRMIAIERKRTERSKEPFLLMLVEIGPDLDPKERGRVFESIASVLTSSSRDTDVVGWYKERATLGAMFTGLIVTDKSLILTTILNRISTMLRDEVTYDQFNHISLSFHFVPDDWDSLDRDGASNVALYPDLKNPGKYRRSRLFVKHAIDFFGSALGLILCSPFIALTALAIKLTSRGPVFLKQQRIGQFGGQFTLLKFRSMYQESDHSVHRDIVTKLIADQADGEVDSSHTGSIYKLTNDQRITPIGRFLRRTSLDELPQIINVLRGDMSLVGPRPAIPYELSAYQTWHRKRILEAKPGITGLWQVTGRSQVKFDEMVRLDLRYATSWSLRLDLEILLRTPLAVIKGAGPY